MADNLQRQPDTGQWHGGAIAAIIDIAGCYALALLTEGAPPPTMNFRTDYLRPALNTDLTARACVQRAGRTVGVVDIEIRDKADKCIAIGRGSYSMGGRFSSS